MDPKDIRQGRGKDFLTRPIVGLFLTMDVLPKPVVRQSCPSPQLMVAEKLWSNEDRVTIATYHETVFRCEMAAISSRRGRQHEDFVTTRYFAVGDFDGE